MLLLHGWPGDRTGYRVVAPRVSAAADVIVPDLRGFGESDKHEADPAEYNAVAQARSIVGLIDELARWVEEVKKPETRATRLAKTVESLHVGKRAR